MIKGKEIPEVPKKGSLHIAMQPVSALCFLLHVSKTCQSKYSK